MELIVICGIGHAAVFHLIELVTPYLDVRYRNPSNPTGRRLPRGNLDLCGFQPDHGLKRRTQVSVSRENYANIKLLAHRCEDKIDGQLHIDPLLRRLFCRVIPRISQRSRGYLNKLLSPPGRNLTRTGRVALRVTTTVRHATVNMNECQRMPRVMLVRLCYDLIADFTRAYLTLVVSDALSVEEGLARPLVDVLVVNEDGNRRHPIGPSWA